MSDITVYKPGTSVKIISSGVNDVVGIIKGAGVFMTSSILYEVVWWNGKVRNVEWLPESEIEPMNYNNIVKIGFHN